MAVMFAGLCQALAELFAEVGEQSAVTGLCSKSLQKSDVAHMALDRQIGQNLGILAEQPPLLVLFAAAPARIVIATARAQENGQQDQRAQDSSPNGKADRQIGPRDPRQPFCNLVHPGTKSNTGASDFLAR